MKHVLYVAVSAIALTACSSPKPGTPAYIEQQVSRVADESPGWYTSPPDDDGKLIGVATATSSDLQLAIDKASLQARRQIAEKISGKLSLKTTDHLEDARVIASHFERTVKETAINAPISGYIVKDQKIVIENGGYRVWVLLNAPLVQAIAQSDHTARDDFRASKAYQELDNDIKKASEPPQPASAPRPEVIKE